MQKPICHRTHAFLIAVFLGALLAQPGAAQDASERDQQLSETLRTAYRQVREEEGADLESYLTTFDDEAHRFGDHEARALTRLVRSVSRLSRNDLEGALGDLQAIESLDAGESLSPVTAGLAASAYGTYHLLQGGLAAARERYSAALAVLEATGTAAWARVNLLQNLAYVIDMQGEPEAAMAFLDRSVAMARSNGLTDLLVDALVVGARLELSLDHLARAEAMASEALASDVLGPGSLESVIAMRVLGESLRRQDRDGESKAVLRTALSAATTHGHEGERLPIAIALAEINEEEGAFAESTRYYREALDASRAHFDLERMSRLKTLDEAHQLDLERIEARLLTAELRRRNQVTLALAVGALLLTLVSVLLLRSWRVQNRINQALSIANDRLEEMSMTDALTAIANRRGLLAYAETARRRAERSEAPMTVLLIDLDNFKRINDEHGHEAGDQVLVDVARILRRSLRQQDEVARWGGEEFALLLPDTNQEGGRFIAEKIRRRISQLTTPTGALTATVGVAEIKPGEPIREALARADERLYEGKRAGRDRVVAGKT